MEGQIGEKWAQGGRFCPLGKRGLIFEVAAALGQAAGAATARAVVQSAEEGPRPCPMSAQRREAVVMRIL